MPNPPTPIEVRRVTGNPGKRKIPDRRYKVGELKPSTGRTPADLKQLEDPAAEIMWRRLWKLRQELGLEAQVYDPAAELLCRAWAGMQRGSETAARETRYLLGEFGMTPASRARLGISGSEEEEDELEKILGRRSA